MKERFYAVLLILAFLLPDTASAQSSHVVSDEQVDAALASAAARRDADLAAIGDFLDRPSVAEVAERLHLRTADLRAAAAALSDEETRDLARRAASLDTDPVAGQTYFPDWSGMGTALVVVGLIALILIALAAWGLTKVL